MARQATMAWTTAPLLTAATMLPACATTTTDPDEMARVGVARQSQHCTPIEQITHAGAAVVERRDDGSTRIRVSMGRQNTGGYAILIESRLPEKVTGDTAFLELQWQTPEPDQALTQVMTRPCLELIIPATYNAVVLLDQNGHERYRLNWPDEPSGDNDG